MPSAKSHFHEVGLPPDVSRNSTSTSGPITSSAVGVMVSFALKAAFGAVPTGTDPPPAIALIPALTGKLDSAPTLTDPPTTFAMNGVITPKVQVRRTVTVSPSTAPAPSLVMSVKVGAGTTGTPPDSGSSQLVAAASARISLR